MTLDRNSTRGPKVRTLAGYVKKLKGDIRNLERDTRKRPDDPFIDDEVREALIKEFLKLAVTVSTLGSLSATAVFSFIYWMDLQAEKHTSELHAQQLALTQAEQEKQLRNKALDVAQNCQISNSYAAKLITGEERPLYDKHTTLRLPHDVKVLETYSEIGEGENRRIFMDSESETTKQFLNAGMEIVIFKTDQNTFGPTIWDAYSDQYRYGRVYFIMPNQDGKDKERKIGKLPYGIFVEPMTDQQNAIPAKATTSSKEPAKTPDHVAYNVGRGVLVRPHPDSQVKNGRFTFYPSATRVSRSSPHNTLT